MTNLFVKNQQSFGNVGLNDFAIQFLQI
jgi:hypothetical protein